MRECVVCRGLKRRVRLASLEAEVALHRLDALDERRGKVDRADEGLVKTVDELAQVHLPLGGSRDLADAPNALAERSLKGCARRGTRRREGRPLDGRPPPDARRAVADRRRQGVDALRGDVDEVHVQLRPEEHAHGSRPPSRKVAKPDAQELVGRAGRVHELAPHVVAVVATLDLFHVVGRQKDEDDVRGVDSAAHGVNDVSPHVRLVEPHVQVAATQFRDDGRDARVVVALGAPVVRREDANGRRGRHLCVWYR